MPEGQTTTIPAVPIRTPFLDENGNLSRPWIIFFEQIATPGPAGPAGPAGTGGGVVLARTTQVSSAQILALGATEIELVPPAGAGNTIVVHNVVLIFTFGTAGYTSADPSSDLVIDLGGASTVLIGPDYPLSMAGTLEALAAYPNPVAATGPLPANGFYFDKGVYLKQLATPFAAGDGTLSITVFYSAVSVAGVVA